jgi:hypothetical protein
MHRLYHDFNKTDASPVAGMVAAPLVCRGSHEDLKKLSLELREGMKVLLYQEDIGPEETPDFLEVEATIRFDKRLDCFCAEYAHDDLMYRTERAKKKPIQPPQTTTGSCAPDRV